LTAAERNDGFSRIVSLRALIIREPILTSFAQDGTKPQRADTSCRAGAPSSESSSTMGTSWVGAVFQLGRSSSPDGSSASKKESRSPVARVIT
jgi:hypothetical protein